MRRALIIEDEPMVANMTARYLQKLGWETHVESGADGAWRWIAEGNPFILVIADHGLPGITGVDIARMLKRDRPEVKVVIHTGDSNLVVDGVDGIAHKPFTLRDWQALLPELFN